jgi:DHA1 family bicyclomycin/chloramphenicol resistance-like MFS transporter
MFAHVAGSPSVLIGRFGITPGLYAGLFTTTAAGIVFGAFLFGQMLRRVPGQVLLATGVVLSLAAPLYAAVVLLSGNPPLARLIPCLIFATFAYGLIALSASRAALDLLPEAAGSPPPS